MTVSSIRPRLALLFSLSLVIAASVAGCGSDDNPAPAAGCTVSAPSVDTNGVKLADSCGNSLVLKPSVRIDGVWSEVGSSVACSVVSGDLVCPAGDLGESKIHVEGTTWKVSFSAKKDVTVEGISMVGVAAVEGATSFLSQGFQSWSQSGVVALGAAVDEATLDKMRTKRGDDEVFRDGTSLSWEYTYVGGGDVSLFAGALTSSVFRPWVEVSGSAKSVALRIGSGAGGERVSVASGASIEGEPFMIEISRDLSSTLRKHAGAISSRHATVKANAGVGWNSWYELWDGVDEAVVRANAAKVKGVLGDRAPSGAKLRIVVDDGWESAWGDWTPNAKFPSGLDGLASDLAKDGFDMGVWLAPLLASKDSEVFKAHPDWFLSDATYEHLKNGTMHVLDVTHPDAAAHLTSVIQQLVAWGYDLLKIDFLFAGTYDTPRHEAMTGMQAYDLALSIIRKAAGESTILIAVGAPAMPTLAHVDGWRVGPDIALEPTDIKWPYLPEQARTLATRWQLCAVTLCDADPMMLRKLTQDEIEAGAWTVAFSGGALFLSDDLRSLPAERTSWGLDANGAKYALSGVPAEPLDPFPSDPPAKLSNVIDDLVGGVSTQVVPRLWKLSDGSRVIWNATDESIEVEGIVVSAHGAKKID